MCKIKIHTENNHILMSHKTNLCCRRRSDRGNRSSHIPALHGACYTLTSNHREVVLPVNSHRTVVPSYLSVKLPKLNMDDISRPKF